MVLPSDNDMVLTVNHERPAFQSSGISAQAVAGSPYANSRFRKDEKMAAKFARAKRTQMSPHKCERCATTLRDRAKKYDARKVARRIGADVRNSVVSRQEDAILLLNLLHQSRICGPVDSLIEYRVGAMPRGEQIEFDFDRQVLVDFESHNPASGRRLSSRAKSAA